MPPPDLAADAPVLDVEHPFEVGLLPLRGHDAGGAGLHRLDRLFGQRLDVDVPLQGEVGLDDGLAAVAFPDGIGVGLDLLQESQFFKIGDDLAARFIALQPPVGAAVLVDEPGIVEHVDEFEVVALADLEVVEVVSRRDLHHPGAEFAVDVVVGDHRDLPAEQRQNHALADQVGVALVLGVDRHRGITEHRLRTGGGDDQEAVARP